MAKIPIRNLWCRKKWLAKAATTSAGKHDVIVEMTDVHGANEKRKEEERRREEMDLRIHLSEKRRKGSEQAMDGDGPRSLF